MNKWLATKIGVATHPTMHSLHGWGPPSKRFNLVQDSENGSWTIDGCSHLCSGHRHKHLASLGRWSSPKSAVSKKKLSSFLEGDQEDENGEVDGDGTMSKAKAFEAHFQRTSKVDDALPTS